MKPLTAVPPSPCTSVLQSVQADTDTDAAPVAAPLRRDAPRTAASADAKRHAEVWRPRIMKNGDRSPQNGAPDGTDHEGAWWAAQFGLDVHDVAQRDGTPLESRAPAWVTEFLEENELRARFQAVFARCAAAIADHAPRGIEDGDNVSAIRMVINVGAFAYNYHVARKLVGPDAEVGAVIKADGYGLGATRIAAALIPEGCRHFFVADLNEAKALREGLTGRGVAHDDVNVYVLNGVYADTARHYLNERYKATPILNDLKQIDEYVALAREINDGKSDTERKKLPAVIQFDTLMRRMGIAVEDQDRFFAELAQYQAHLDIRFAMSHLADAGNLASDVTKEQISQFNSIMSRFPQGMKGSLAASAGLAYHIGARRDLVRPGSFIHGVEVPARAETGWTGKLRPAVHRVEAAITQTRILKAGEGVGYGLTGAHQLRDRKIAVIAGGAADGILRELGNTDSLQPVKGKAFFNGKELPFVGKPSMDVTVIDITDAPELKRGDKVALVHPDYTVEDMGRAAGNVPPAYITIPMGKSNRVHKIEVHIPYSEPAGNSEHATSAEDDANPANASQAAEFERETGKLVAKL